MKKSFLAALVSSAVASTVVLASAGLVQATCPFSKLKDISDPVTSNNPSSSTFKQQDSNKMGIAGAGIATLAGLFVGGMVLKSRLTRGNESVPAEVSQAELPPEASFETSTFAIVVPPEALTSSKVASEVSEPEPNSVR